MKFTKDFLVVFEKLELELDEAKVKVLASFVKNLITLLSKNGFSLSNFMNAVCDAFDEELREKIERHMELVIQEIEKLENIQNDYEKN